MAWHKTLNPKTYCHRGVIAFANCARQVFPSQYDGGVDAAEGRPRPVEAARGDYLLQEVIRRLPNHFLLLHRVTS